MRNRHVSSLSRWGALTLSGALAAVLSSASLGYGAEFNSPMYGGGGGTRTYNLDCGRGAVLVGAQGKAGEWVDSLIAICQQVNADGTLGSRFTRGPTGGPGGVVKSDPCPNGQVVGEIWAKSKLGFVSAIRLGCDVWNSQFRRRNGTASSTETSTIFSSGLSYTIEELENNLTTCPSGIQGKALRGKSGIYVDSVYLVCDGWDQ